MASIRTVRSCFFLVAALLAAALWAPSARADVFEMLDGKSKIIGKLIQYYDGVFTVEIEGQTRKLSKEQIKSISFQLPAPRPEFSTPEKTFERSHKAMIEGNIEKVIDCYALPYQGIVATQMDHSAESLKKMQKEAKDTHFSHESPAVVTGDRATLKVKLQNGDDSATHDVVFVRENGEWKLVLPL